MKYLFILAILYASTVCASEIDALLEKYKSESELSKKTKNENAGHLIVFTRDDLERMQVETLKDVLKSTRFFRYLENRVGEPDMLNIDPILYSSKSVRVYLNDNELVLPVTGSGFLLFGNMDMDFIDHVEVYEGFPSFEFAIEPATVVIKLYTKVPQRDAGSRIKGLVASHGSHKENIYTAGFTSNNIAYFAYANHKENKRDTYAVDAQTVKRDQNINQFYASFEKGKSKVELHALTSNNDAFLGIVPYAVPKSTNLEHRFFNASYTLKSDDETLSVRASYIYSDGKYNANYPSALPAFLGGYSDFKQKNKTDTFTTVLKKKFIIDAHTVSIGLQYRYKNFQFDDIQTDNIASPYSQKYNKENIYSLFIEDSILLSEHDLLGLSVMQQHYDRNKDMEDETVTQLRLSYIHNKDNWIAKTFLSRQEFIPEPYMTAAAHVGNVDLLPEIYSAATQEISYKNTQTLSKIVFGYGNTRRFMIQDFTSGQMVNSKNDLGTYYAAVEFNYLFRKKDKLVLQADYVKIAGTDTNEDVKHYDYLVRMLNTVGKFDIFNELVINKGFENLDTGYDYSAGIKYRVTPDMHIGFKGENIFNTGLTRKYYYNLVPTQKQLEVPVIEQKFMLSMEYLF